MLFDYLVESFQSEVDRATAISQGNVLLTNSLHFSHHGICLLHLHCDLSPERKVSDGNERQNGSRC